jgi:hypothetical protein
MKNDPFGVYEVAVPANPKNDDVPGSFHVVPSDEYLNLIEVEVVDVPSQYIIHRTPFWQRSSFV